EGCNGFNVGLGSHVQFFRTGNANLEIDTVCVVQQRCKQFFATIGGVFHDAGNFVFQLGIFSVQCRAVISIVATVSGLQGQIFHAERDIGDFIQSAVGSLQHADGVLGVTLSNGHAASLCSQTVGDLQTSSVVSGAVDAQAGAQTLHGSGQGAVVLAQGVLGNQGSKVGMDGQ